MNDRIVLRGQKEISEAAGLNWKIFSYYVREKGLPVFRIDNKGTWLATPEDLTEWIRRQRDENLRSKK